MLRARHSAAPTRRLLASLAIAGLAIGVTACGGDDDDADASLPNDSVATTVESTTPGDDTEADDEADADDDGDEVAAGPSYTIVSGDTLSGIAGRAGVPLEDLIAVNDWSDGADHVILPGDEIVLPEGATVPSPRTSTTTASNSGSGSGNSGSGSGNSGSGSGNSGSGNTEGGYTSTSSRSSEEDSLEIASPLADGEYGATATSDGVTITFLLGRYLSWETCASQLPDPADADMACASPPLYEEGNGTTISVVGSDLDRATVLAGAGMSTDALLVDGAELARLIVGEAPASDAPSDFQFVANTGYRITIEDGEVVAADQQFHS